MSTLQPSVQPHTAGGRESSSGIANQKCPVNPISSGNLRTHDPTTRRIPVRASNSAIINPHGPPPTIATDLSVFMPATEIGPLRAEKTAAI
jgi:hypothetical protein